MTTCAHLAIEPCGRAEVSDALVRFVRDSEDADLRFYLRRVLNDPSLAPVYVDSCRELARLAGLRARRPRQRVLDVGCGFGWHSMAISLLSGAEVVANDIRPSMCAGVEREVRRLRDGGMPVHVQALCGDVCTLLQGRDLEPRSFDAIVSVQTIEHVHDLEAMLRTCLRLLRPGGRIVLTNDNNVHNPRGLAEARQMWRRRDRDWDYIRELQAGKPGEMKDQEPFAVTRERLIREARPDLAEGEVESLVSATAGMLAGEITELSSGWRSGDPLPAPPALSWCRDPVSGEYVERQLDPFALVSDLRKAGFRHIRLRHAYRRRPLRWLNRSVVRPLDKLLFRRKAVFVLVARKP